MIAPHRVLVGVLLLLGSCATIAPFSQTAYEQTTRLKAEALILMDQATEKYELHKAEADRVRLDMASAYEFAKGRPKNEVSTRQWELVRDPDGASLGHFLKRWENDGVLHPMFVSEEKKLIADQLDALSSLESGKPRSQN